MDLEKSYRILELRPGALPSDIKQAYRKLALEWHPDLYPYGPELRRRCEEKMKLINAAYEYLRRQANEGIVQDVPTKEEQEFTREPATDNSWKPPPDTAHESWISKSTGEAPRRSNHGAWPWESIEDSPDFPGLMRVAVGFLLTVVIMIFTVTQGPDRGSLFTLLRITTVLSSLHGAFYSIRRGYWEISMALILLAVIMNPIMPARMENWEWIAFSILCPLFMLWVWIVLYTRESQRR